MKKKEKIVLKKKRKKNVKRVSHSFKYVTCKMSWIVKRVQRNIIQKLLNILNPR